MKHSGPLKLPIELLWDQLIPLLTVHDWHSLRSLRLNKHHWMLGERRLRIHFWITITTKVHLKKQTYIYGKGEKFG